MASGMAIGGLAQGLAQGLNQGFAIGRMAQEREKFELERPILQANAEKAKQETAFQQDYAERLKELYAEAKGGEIQNEDGTVTTKAPMDPVQMELRASDAMKQSMLKAGLIDFKRLKEARDYSKMIEEEGTIDALQYALKNPNDQAGIREKFNAVGKIKLGEDVTIGIEQGEFGPKVVGYRSGEGGKQVKAFDQSDLLRPYLSASTMAQLDNQKEITAVKERGDNARNAASNATQLQLGNMRERAADKRLEYQENAQNQRLRAQEERDDAKARAEYARKNQDAVATIANTNVTGALRNLTAKEDQNLVIKIHREAAALAERMVADPADSYYGKPQSAFNAAFGDVAAKYKLNVATPTFTQPPKKQ